MPKKVRWFVYPFLLGMLLNLNRMNQPFRLRTLSLKQFSPELEWKLREWSEGFLFFHPLWLVKRHDLKVLERNFPFRILTSWAPVAGTLEITAEPFDPALCLAWQYGEYLVNEQGTAWPKELWEQSLSVEIPHVPCFDIEASVQLFRMQSAGNSLRLALPFEKLFNLRKILFHQPGLRTVAAVFGQRGGVDVIRAEFETVKTKEKISFISSLGGLDKTLVVMRQLVSSLKSGQKLFIDATYDDKIIIRREQAAQSGSGDGRENI